MSLLKILSLTALTLMMVGIWRHFGAVADAWADVATDARAKDWLQFADASLPLLALASGLLGSVLAMLCKIGSACRVAGILSLAIAIWVQPNLAIWCGLNGEGRWWPNESGRTALALVATAAWCFLCAGAQAGDRPERGACRT